MRTAVVCGVLALLAVAAGVRAAASVDEGVVGETAAQADAAAGQQQQETVTVEKVLGTGGSEVVELGSSAVSDEGVHDWADVVGRDLPVLVEFYLPTCGHCQGFAPEYERVAKAFHSQPVIVARIDANRWTSISDQYRVKSVPDIRFFPAGSTDDQPYIRSRVATDIVGFLNEYAGTSVAFDYSFRQQHGGAAAAAAAVVDEGTCPVVHASLLEADAEAEADADADADAADALDAAEAEAADAEEAVEDADEAADEAEEESDAEDALADAIADSEAEADAHETEAEIAEDAELEGEAEAEAEADEADADV